LWPKWRRRAAIRLAPTSGPLVGHPRAVRGLVLTRAAVDVAGWLVRAAVQRAEQVLRRRP
ncbi:MAG TPA: hypothetical protein PLJ48_10650, partial [Dermatophilaceae bacterium]|nr:hypothetical protein [Dermatophilaceae bacterium]